MDNSQHTRVPKIYNPDDYKWQIVLVKTIEHKEPIYYRLVNLLTLEQLTIPAFRILDILTGNGMKIINGKCLNNSLLVTDDDGYETYDDIITTDEFDEVPTLFDWAVENNNTSDDLGTSIINTFDSSKNNLSPSGIKIDTPDRYYWTDKAGHSIYIDFATYLSMFKGYSPILALEENGELASFEFWCYLTNNIEALAKYKAATKNVTEASKISYRSNKQIWIMPEIGLSKPEEPYILTDYVSKITQEQENTNNG